ncbi:MAG: hypothetical protein AB7T37_09720 [Dehalococcoidia bacterium]
MSDGAATGAPSNRRTRVIAGAGVLAGLALASGAYLLGNGRHSDASEQVVIPIVNVARDSSDAAATVSQSPSSTAATTTSAATSSATATGVPASPSSSAPTTAGATPTHPGVIVTPTIDGGGATPTIPGGADVTPSPIGGDSSITPAAN